MGNDLRNPIPPPIYAKFALKIITPFGKKCYIAEIETVQKNAQKKRYRGDCISHISKNTEQ